MTGNATRLQTLRWVQLNAAPGGAARLNSRVHDTNSFSRAILYFMLFDPSASTPTDPRTAYSLNFFSLGLGRILARTDWSADATFFDYKLSWNTTDHQGGDGNHFELYRKGEWLTKVRTGYDLDFSASDNTNTLSLENNVPDHNEGYRHDLWQRGSQWLYNGLNDPQLVAHSFGAGFVYALGDATNLYNSTAENATDISHASRSIIWIKPDHVIVYDRASSKTGNRFKRFWLNVPTLATVSGSLSTMTTAKGQQLFVKTLLPSNATITAQLAPQEPSGEAAHEEPMKYRIKVEAPNNPNSVRFLNVLQGADAGVSPDSATHIQSSSGSSFEGVLLENTVVLFPVDLNTTFTSLTYTVASNATDHIITGLTPNTGYNVSTQSSGNSLTVTVIPGSAYSTDSGGVLIWGNSLTTALPAGQYSYNYSAVLNPEEDRDASRAKPVSVGAYATGGSFLSLNVALNQFSAPTDIYFAISAPHIDPNNIYIMKSDKTFQALSAGLVPWKSGFTGPVEESIFSNMPLAALPVGSYGLYLLSTPASSLSNYYLWSTSFSVQ